MRFGLVCICLLCFGIVFNSCNEDEPIPSYIKIEAIDLVTDQNTEGWDTEGIKDAWVYIDNNLVGAFELPAHIPVLEEGTHNISIGGGIFLNGISSTRVEYPMYRFYESTITLIPEQTTTPSPSPVVSYFPGINFPWIEDFEGAGFTMSVTVFSDTTFSQISLPDTNVAYGNKTGYFAIDTNHTFFEIKSDDKFSLPTDNTPVFVELDYKSTIPFTVGIFANQLTQIDQVPVVVVNPKSGWNKIYVELAFTLNDFPSSSDFEIFIGTFLPNGSTFGEVYIDNIKLVYSN